MNRLYAYVAVLVVIVLLGLGYLHLYKGGVRSEVKADIATQVVTGAVAQSKKQSIRDYRAQSKKAVALDSVRSATQPLKDFDAKADETPTAASAGATDPWVGVFNDAVRRTNRAIADSVDMP